VILLWSISTWSGHAPALWFASNSNTLGSLRESQGDIALV
jgi:hypothetical protein